MIVDTPGMIDSPMVRSSSLSSIGGRQAAMDRGYDFENVCRWYAERADVILLFFDPDKPGTTGETLSILTSSLVGLDHKLHIILNKADQFRKIHDFARAYGSLCWNLSKVIQRKDLPRIYTMCLPPNYHAVSSGDQSEEGQSLGQGIIDLEATREEVVAGSKSRSCHPQYPPQSFCMDVRILLPVLSTACAIVNITQFFNVEMNLRELLPSSFISVCAWQRCLMPQSGEWTTK